MFSAFPRLALLGQKFSCCSPTFVLAEVLTGAYFISPLCNSNKANDVVYLCKNFVSAALSIPYFLSEQKSAYFPLSTFSYIFKKTFVPVI